MERDIDRSKQPKSVEFVVTLVNGTFSPNAEWTFPYSRFANAIRRQCTGEVNFKRFSWSGANTISARLRAADALKEHVSRVCSEYESRGVEHKHFLICHSHGGLAALYACKDSDFANSISGVACIFTPFIHFRTSKTLIQLTIIGLVLPAIMAAWFYLLINGYFGQDMEPAALLSWFIVPLSLLAIDKLTPFLLARQRRKVDRLNLPAISSEKLLIVKTVGDEAGGLIALANFSSWIVQVILKFGLVLGAIFGGAGGGFLVTMFVALLSYLLLSNGLVPLWVVAGLVLFSLPLIIILRLLLGMANGFDFPLRCFLIEANHEVVPSPGRYSIRLLNGYASRRDENDEPTNTPLTSAFKDALLLVHSEDKHSPELTDLLAKWLGSQ